jgi:Flp pilus assembly protein TadG
MVRAERGQSLVEFAMVAPLVLVLLFAIVDFGRAFQSWITVTNAAREGARLAATGATQQDVVARVQTAASGLSPALAGNQITVTNAQGTTGTSVTVRVSYPLQLITPLGSLLGLLGGEHGSVPNSFTIASTADMRLE